MKKFRYLMFLVMFMLLTGCVRVNYIGQSLPARDEETGGIKYFSSLESIPNDYKPIGRASAIFPMSYVEEQIDHVFTKKALEVGAEAIARVSTKRVLVGISNEVESRPVRPSGSWGQGGTTLDGEPLAVDSFGNRSNLKVVQKEVYKLKVDVVFLVTLELYNEYLNRTSREVVSKLEVDENSQNEEEVLEIEAENIDVVEIKEDTENDTKK